MPQILVVEDDDAIRGLVSEVLRDDGYDVREASNGVEALDRVREQRPDLIVLDLMMPVMDGWTFVEECRPKPGCDDVPIVVTSASHDLPRTAERLTSFACASARQTVRRGWFVGASRTLRPISSR